MFSLHNATFLLAQAEKTRNLFRASKYKNNSSEDAIYGVLILAGIVASVLVLALIMKFREKRPRRKSPKGLFLSLCRAHRLKWSERWLLWRMARLEGLTDPARLFLEPELFDSSSLPAALQPNASRLKNISKRLFAGLKNELTSKGDEQSTSPDLIGLSGAALTVPETAPNLDVPPWPATTLSPSLPPMANFPDASV